LVAATFLGLFAVGAFAARAPWDGGQDMVRTAAHVRALPVKAAADVTPTPAPSTTTTSTIPPPMGNQHTNPVPALIRSGPTTKAFVAITIDDLFGASGTQQLAKVLDIAEARHIHLTLFPTGGALEDVLSSGQQETWRRAVRGGNEIGNHTYTHANLTRLTDEQIRDELNQTQDLLNQVLGPEFAYRMRLMRPPGGAGGYEPTGNARVLRVVTELGYSMVMWGVDSQNTSGFSSYVDKIAARSGGAQNGSIVLVHFTTFSPANIASVFDRLRTERNLEPTTVSGLFAAEPITAPPEEIRTRRLADNLADPNV
jgi:peptidoglycan/xylan/chitin deacetylase (PgdA/CDA1 family)